MISPSPSQEQTLREFLKEQRYHLRSYNFLPYEELRYFKDGYKEYYDKEKFKQLLRSSGEELSKELFKRGLAKKYVTQDYRSQAEELNLSFDLVICSPDALLELLWKLQLPKLKAALSC